VEGTDVNTASAERAFFHQLIRFSDLSFNCFLIRGFTF